MQYARELREYQKSEAYQITSAKIQDKKIKKGQNYSFVFKAPFSGWICIYDEVYFLLYKPYDHSLSNIILMDPLSYPYLFL